MKKLSNQLLKIFGRNEKGVALVGTMVFMVVVTLMAIPVLTFSATGIKTGEDFTSRADTLYAADAGVEDAKWQIKYDQLSGMFSTYDAHDYATIWSYSLPNVANQPEINHKQVNVVLQNDWVPKSITAPDKATANAIINNNKLIVAGGAYGTSSYNIAITYYPGIGENLKVDTIGIWFPPGFTYKANSSNLGSEPATSGYQGGQAAVWSFSHIAFTSLPGANPTDTPMTAKITFNYVVANLVSTTVSTAAAAGATTLNVASTTGFPAAGFINLPNEPAAVSYNGTTATSFTGIPSSGGGSMTVSHSVGQIVSLPTAPDCVSWINTSNVLGLSYTWDDTVRVFHVTSIGSDAFTTLSLLASTGDTTLNVVSTNGFPSAGSLTLANEAAAVTYTGKTATTFTGIPASGTGSITVNHAIGDWVAYGATSVDTYLAKSELRKIGGALNGDYYATGNSLLEDLNGDGVKETRVNSSAIVASPNPSGADNGVPDDANVSASYLYWGTWYSNTTGKCTTVLNDDGSKFYPTGGYFDNYTIWNLMTSGTSNSLAGVWGSSSGDVFAVGAGGTVLHYNGASWSAMTGNTTNALNGVWGSTSSDVFAVGASGTILHYNGTSWSSQTSGTTNTLNSVWGSTSSDVFAVGASGTILHYNGTIWSSQTSGTTNALNSVWGNTGSDVFAVGASGTIRHYDGSSWSSQTSGTTNALNGVWGNTGSDVFAVGASGTVRHSSDGTNWSSQTSGISNALNGIWGQSGSNVFTVGASGTILRYNGTAWSGMTSGTTNALNRVWGDTDSDVFAVGASGTILHYSGSAWNLDNVNLNFKAHYSSGVDEVKQLTQHTAADLSAYASSAYITTLSWEQWASSFMSVSPLDPDICSNFNNWNKPSTNSSWSISSNHFRGHSSSGYNPDLPLLNPVDLSTYTANTVTLAWDQWESNIASGDGLNFELSADGGNTWSNPIKAFDYSDLAAGKIGTLSKTFTYTLATSTYLTGSFKIKFSLVGFSSSNHYAYVDNIYINVPAPVYSSADQLQFALSNDNGATWSNYVTAITGDKIGNSGFLTTATFQYNIPVTYLTTLFKVKLYITGFNGPGQYCNVDNIRINALNPDTGMTFKINNNIVYFDANGNPATSTNPANQVASSKTQVLLTYSYSGTVSPTFNGFAEGCFRDVTLLVTKYAQQPAAPATNFNGHATYSAVSDMGDTGNYQLAHAGWSLVTVFTGPETLGHQLYLYDNFFGSGQNSSGVHVVWNGDGSSGGTITGFVVPQQIQGEVNAAKLNCFVTEGDNQLTGDYIAMNGTKLWDGKTSTSNSKSSPNNVWNALSYLSGGYSIYDGVDIDTLGIDPTANPPQYITWQSQILKPGDTSANIDLYTQQDYWFMIYMIISFRSNTTTGSSLSYLIRG